MSVEYTFTRRDGWRVSCGRVRPPKSACEMQHPLEHQLSVCQSGTSVKKYCCLSSISNIKNSCILPPSGDLQNYIG